MKLRTQPALLAGYADAGLTALRESIVMDIKEKNTFAWLTRFRQTEELYVRTIYALLVVSDDRIPHFFSEVYPNGLRDIYDEVNRIAFAGQGRLDMTLNDPEVSNFKVMDFFNETAHVSFRSQVHAGHLYSIPDWSMIGDLHVARIDTHRDLFQQIVLLFSTGKDREEVLQMLRFQYTNPA